MQLCSTHFVGCNYASISTEHLTTEETKAAECPVREGTLLEKLASFSSFGGKEHTNHPGASLPLCCCGRLSDWIMDLTLWQYQFRIIMLGDSTVGKSSMLKRYTEDLFMECLNQTVGVDFYVHFLEVEPDVRVKLQFWDTAGQERFR